MEKLPNVFITNADTIFDHGSYVHAYPERKFPEDIEYVHKYRYDIAVAALKKIKENNLSGGDCKAFADITLKELGE